jgi:phospholipid/cholesterol/gamma-HCH transport system permease protein
MPADPKPATPKRTGLPIGGFVVIPILEVIGRKTSGVLNQIGGLTFLLIDTLALVWRGLTTKNVRIGRAAVVSQIVRVGVRSIFIVSLVSGVVGLILALQLAPPLDEFGQRAMVANIIGVAVLRELGPLIGAIVLTGFAGASIAAEIGTMVVSEEIEALEAHALNPIRFLVVPRVLASVISMTALGVIASGMAVLCAMLISITVLEIPYETFTTNLVDQVKLSDFMSGFIKGGVFGLLIGLIACYNGLAVSGGAAGVGNATTNTVVQSVVAIIFADLVFTAAFFALGLV